MDDVQALKELGSAIADAKQKADTLTKLRAELAAYVASKQSGIDDAQHAYDDAKVAMDRLQDQLRTVLGALMPDPRYRASK